MEKEATINSLFGETIYCTNVDNDNQTIAKHIESFVKEKPGRTAATTDVKGNTMFTDLEEAKDNLLRRNQATSSAPSRYKRQVEEYFRRIAEGE